ncbi:LA_1326/LA_4305 family lipoprotein [Leptospira sp. GIMC2001]|uniref:LA_1326/LA_4305 family lipoprotein n=1 Tax=Leptospira sp. GIMC2001 TaxID=1513297 RepID=UPI00234A31BA|nr:hypothetical protein [Leptospira sp. GIMC2001]WCL50867.1 hypothetical protein O4O04_08655 [Leptospira sp. GIMC2001]
MNRIHLSVSLLILTFVLNCASGVNARKLIHRSYKAGYYSLEVDAIATRDRRLLEESPLKHPIKNITEDQWKGILGNLKFKKESSVGDMIYYIFPEDELNDIIPDLKVAVSDLDETKTLIVITKFNDVKGVVSRDLRTTFLLFQNKKGINILFSEIHQDMIGIETSNYYEWSVIPEIQFRNNYDPINIVENKFFDFALVNGFKNRMWLQFDTTDPSKFKFEKRKTEEPEIDKESNKLAEDSKKPKSEIIIRDVD